MYAVDLFCYSYLLEYLTAHKSRVRTRILKCKLTARNSKLKVAAKILTVFIFNQKSNTLSLQNVPGK